MTHQPQSPDHGRGRNQYENQRAPKQIAGKLVAQWVNSPQRKYGMVSRLDPSLDGDLLYQWGENIANADSHLLHAVLTARTYNWETRTHDIPSFVEDLVARGYDLRTLRFSIYKKVAKEVNPVRTS